MKNCNDCTLSAKTIEILQTQHQVGKLALQEIVAGFLDGETDAVFIARCMQVARDAIYKTQNIKQ